MKRTILKISVVDEENACLEGRIQSQADIEAITELLKQAIEAKDPLGAAVINAIILFAKGQSKKAAKEYESANKTMEEAIRNLGIKLEGRE